MEGEPINPATKKGFRFFVNFQWRTDLFNPPLVHQQQTMPYSICNIQLFFLWIQAFYQIYLHLYENFCIEDEHNSWESTK